MQIKALFQMNCVACGAAIQMYSPTSVFVVCNHCQNTNVRTPKSIVNAGVRSSALVDISPFSLHQSIGIEGRTFLIIGRAQLQYSHGIRNFWRIRYEDATEAWIDDCAGKYILFDEQDQHDEINLTNRKMIAGITRIRYQRYSYVVGSYIETTIEQTSIQGEIPYLPFVATELYTQHVVELNNLALDYSQNPQVQYLRLAILHLNNHVLAVDYSSDTSKYKTFIGKMLPFRTPTNKLSANNKVNVQAVTCPNCGGVIEAMSIGIHLSVICQYCLADLSCQNEILKVKEIYKMRNAQDALMTLKIGQVIRMNSITWTVVGVVRLARTDQDVTLNYVNFKLSSRPFTCGGSWYEYLLYSKNNGFILLLEDEQHNWFSLKEQLSWPQLNYESQPQYYKKPMKLEKYYGSSVVYAAGAFFRELKPRQIVYYQEFSYKTNAGKNMTLRLQRNRSDARWMQMRSLPVEQLEKALGYQLKKPIEPQWHKELMVLALFFVIIPLLLQFIFGKGSRAAFDISIYIVVFAGIVYFKKDKNESIWEALVSLLKDMLKG